MAFFGVDIGTTTIKIAQLQKEEGGFRLVSAGIAKAPSPGLASEAEKDLVAVAEAIKKLRKEANITCTEVVSSLPESNVFTKVIELPAMTEEEIGQALHWELEEIVPISLAEANFDWQVIKKDSSSVSVLVAIAPKMLVEKYVRVFGLADLRPVGLETEVLALVRALKAAGPTKVKLIIDFGAKSINIVVIKDEEIILTRSVPTAGKAITRSISTSLSLEEEVAEEYKKTYGLAADQFEGKIQEAIRPVFNLLLAEIKKSLEFTQEQRKDGVEMIILSGGGANFPEFSETITRQFGVEVQIADPFSQLKGEVEMIADLKKLSPSFTIVIGLAMKEI